MFNQTTNYFSSAPINLMNYYLGEDNFLGQILTCAADFSLCKQKIALWAAKHMAYQMPKFFVETLSSLPSLAYWSGKQIAPEWIKNPMNLRPLFSHSYAQLQIKAQELSFYSTHLITGKSIEVLKKEAMLATAINETVFKGIDLLGPFLQLSFLANKSLENILEAGHDFKLLVTGVREESKIIHTNSTEFKEVISHTTLGLVWNVFWETVFAAGTGAGAYFTYEGIRANLQQAILSSEEINASVRATTLTTALLIVGVAPLIISKIFSHLPKRNKSVLPPNDLVPKMKIYPDTKPETIENERKDFSLREALETLELRDAPLKAFEVKNNVEKEVLEKIEFPDSVLKILKAEYPQEGEALKTLDLGGSFLNPLERSTSLEKETLEEVKLPTSPETV